jgi:hypothetical protein
MLLAECSGVTNPNFTKMLRRVSAWSLNTGTTAALYGLAADHSEVVRAGSARDRSDPDSVE